MRKRNIVLYEIALVIGAFFGSVAHAETFEAGQIWTYQTRSGEESSTLTVLGIEDLPGIKVIMVRVNDISIDHYSHGEISAVPFMPFTEELLDKEVKEKTGQVNEIPDFSAQYDDWKRDPRWPWSWQSSIVGALDALQRAYNRVRPQSNQSLKSGTPQSGAP